MKEKNRVIYYVGAVLLIVVAVLLGLTIRNDMQKKKDARKPHEFQEPDLIYVYHGGWQYVFEPGTSEYTNTVKAVADCWEKSQDERFGFEMTGIGIEAKKAKSADRVVLHYDEPIEWQNWNGVEDVSSWTYGEMTFFFSCDAVFGEDASCIAVLSEDTEYASGYRELVMEEETYEKVLSAASNVTSNAIAGRVLTKPTKILLYQNREEYSYTKEDERYQEIYNVVRKVWDDSKVDGALVFAMLLYLDPVQEPEDLSRLVFCYDPPVGWGMYNESYDYPANTYTFFLKGFQTNTRGYCLVSKDETYLERAFIIELREYQRILDVCYENH